MKKILTIFKKNEKIKVLPARIELATFALLKYRLLTYKHDALPLCYGSRFCNFKEFDFIFKSSIIVMWRSFLKNGHRYKYHMCLRLMNIFKPTKFYLITHYTVILITFTT